MFEEVEPLVRWKVTVAKMMVTEATKEWGVDVVLEM